MNFKTAALVEQVVWDLRLSDQQRGENRAQINRLFNGFPPWTAAEAEENGAKTNCNFLDAPKFAADARRSYNNAFLKTPNYFTVELDYGPQSKREHYGAVITKQINRVMKQSLPFFEVIRSQMGSTVLHGIGPVNWDNEFCWQPRSVGIEDILIPSNTLLSLENLDYFAIFRQYTAPKLQEMISRKNIDPGWNISLAKQAIAWCVQQSSSQRSYTETLAPEKVQEMIKQDGGFYGTDFAPTIDCWDFYYFSSEGDKSGWRRRIVLETPGSHETNEKPDKNLIGQKCGQWLYSSGNRVYAEKIEQIVHFQFGDLSATTPFKYHSVRSLGWLIYAVCHLQNRLRCKVNDATFENLLNYFRISNPDDHERLTKIDLHNFGIVPEGVEFVKQADRWQINHNLVVGTMNDNREMLNEAAAQYREGRGQASSKEKTATEIMAEVNSASALVGSMLMLAYTYARGQYAEICRRFCKTNSTDSGVNKFRLACLKRGVPEEALDTEYWDIRPEQVPGDGNKMLQVAMADKLMAIRPQLDPDAQRKVTRKYVQANSSDPSEALSLVPDKPILVTESVHDAQLMIGTLMQGVTVAPRAGQEYGQITTALLGGMAEICKRILSTTKLPTMPELVGLSNLAATIEKYNQQFGQDPQSQQAAKQNDKDLAALTALIKKWGGELQKQQGAENDQAAAAEAAVTQAKVQSIQLQAQTKAQIDQASAQQQAGINQATAAQQQQQSEAAFRQQQRQDDEAHTADLRRKLKETAVATAAADLKTEADIQNARKKAAAAPKPKPSKKE